MNDTLEDGGTSLTTVIVSMVMSKIVLSVVTGWVAAAVTSRFLVNIFADMLLEVSIPLIMCYLSYYVAEAAIDGSGVIACVVFGFRLDRNSICPDNHEFLHKFFHMLAFLANTLIFFMVGIIIVDVINPSVWMTGGKKCNTGDEFVSNPLGGILKSVGLYVILSLVRLVSTILVKPLMKQKTRQFDVTYKEVLVSICVRI